MSFIEHMMREKLKYYKNTDADVHDAEVNERIIAALA